jgi:hypothetical protein
MTGCTVALQTIQAKGHDTPKQGVLGLVVAFLRHTYIRKYMEVISGGFYPHAIVGLVDFEGEAVCDDGFHQQRVWLVTHLEDILLVDQAVPSKCGLQHTTKSDFHYIAGQEGGYLMPTDKLPIALKFELFR